MCRPKSSPYSSWNSAWPDLSTGIASRAPLSLTFLATAEPNCSSTSAPASSRGAPRAMACSNASKMRSLVSLTLAWISGDSGSVAPKRPFEKELRWSNAST